MSPLPAAEPLAASQPPTCDASMWRLFLTLVFILGSRLALGDDLNQAMPPPGSAVPPAFAPPGAGIVRTPSTYGAAMPSPGQDIPRTYGASQPNWIAPTETAPLPRVDISPTLVEPLAESTWYFRQESFRWNERIESMDFVNEYGPLSTLGYTRRRGPERLRIELFGGTVAYDGGAQDEYGGYEPYHQSFGTNYLGWRGEYDLLIEPASWSRMRLLCGVGTRFWFRDLRGDVTPLGTQVIGYQETWWTFYPYIGLESKDYEGPGLRPFGSIRVGVTPLTYQHATYFDTTVYPRCGLTGQMQLGVRYQKFSLSAFAEVMTWGASAIVDYSYQPESRMLTVGGQLGYTF
jgi:hypothetical protein